MPDVATIDPRITASIGAGGSQINPLEMFGRAAAIRNMLTQGQLMQQEQLARQTIGQIMQQTANPDGSPNYDKALPIIGAHPNTAWYAPTYMNTLASTNQINAQAANINIQTKAKKAEMLSGIWLAAGKDPKNTGPDTMAPYLSQALDEGALDGGPNGLREATMHLVDPKTGLGGRTDQDWRDGLTNMGLALAHGANALHATSSNFGVIGSDSNGNSVYGWSQQMRQGISDVFGGQPYSPTPTQSPATTGLAGAMSAGPTAGAAAANAGAAPGAPGIAPPTTPAPPAAAPAAPQRPSISPTIPGPAQQQMLKDVETMRGDYNNQAGHASALQRVADQLQDALKQVKGGAGASAYQQAAQYMQTLGVKDKYVDEIANGSLPAGLKADMLATVLGTTAVRQLLLSQSGGEGSAGRLTNLEFGKIVDIFPHIDTDPRAADSIFKFIRSQNTLLNAKASAYNDTYNRFHSHQPLAGEMQNPTQFEPYWTSQLLKRGLISQGMADNLNAPAAAVPKGEVGGNL
jgi:hypothetical protein